MIFLLLSGSTVPVFGKQLTEAFSPVSLLFISELMGGLFVSMWFGIPTIVKKFRELKKSDRWPLFASCFVNSTIAPLLWFMGLSQTTAVNAELFSRAELLFLIILSVILIHEKFTRQHMLSLAIIVFGILCVALHGFSNGLDVQMGDVLIIASAFAYAVGGIIVKKYLGNIAPELIIMGRTMIATTLFFLVSPFVTINLSGELKLVNGTILIALIGYGFITKFLGIYGFYQAIEHLKVRTVSMFGTLAVVGGMAFAAVYLGEHIHMYQVVGGAFIVLGVLLTQKHGVHPTTKHHEHHIRQHHRHHL